MTRYSRARDSGISPAPGLRPSHGAWEGHLWGPTSSPLGAFSAPRPPVPCHGSPPQEGTWSSTAPLGRLRLFRRIGYDVAGDPPSCSQALPTLLRTVHPGVGTSGATAQNCPHHRSPR